MARHSLGAKTTGAGTTVRPCMALHGVAGGGGTVREIGIFNTTNTACDYKVVRLTAAGTPGGTVTAPTAQKDQNLFSAAPLLVLAQLYTADFTANTDMFDLGYRASLGAAIGAGVIWTFGESGLQITNATSSGIGVVVENGTGQLLQAYFVWDE